jgi:hypothetical protein
VAATIRLEDEDWAYLEALLPGEQRATLIRLLVAERRETRGNAPFAVTLRPAQRRFYASEARADGTHLCLAFARKRQRDRWVLQDARREMLCQRTGIPEWITIEELRDLPTYDLPPVVVEEEGE